MPVWNGPPGGWQERADKLIAEHGDRCTWWLRKGDEDLRLMALRAIESRGDRDAWREATALLREVQGCTDPVACPTSDDRERTVIASRRIRSMRKAQGRTMGDVADAMGVAVSHVSDLETGRLKWTLDEGHRYLRALGLEGAPHSCRDCQHCGAERDEGWAACTHPDAQPVDVRTREVPPPAWCPLRQARP
jgi:hypothetical protein